MWNAIQRTGSVLPQAFAKFAVMAVLLPNQAAATPGAECEDKALRVAKIRCFFDGAVSANQSEVCERAKEPEVQFMCLSLYAEHTLDVEPCRRIAHASSAGQALRDACFSGVAIARRDPAGCEKVHGPLIRDSCYMMLVVQFGADRKICGQIDNAMLKRACSE